MSDVGQTHGSTTRTVCPGDVHRAIVDALVQNAATAARHLDVGAFGGEVIVCGDVSSAREQAIVIEAARRFPGVTRVTSLVRVRDREGES
jgi:osmotically-inducible protein OsmY